MMWFGCIIFWLKKTNRLRVGIVQSLVNAPGTLLLNPRRGEVVKGYEPREIRQAIIGSYEMHYELQGDVLIVLRIWHQREDR